LRNHQHDKCEFNCDNRKYIISQGCCPNCYAPEPCKREIKILKLIASIVESDAGFESDCVKLDVLQGLQISEREKGLAELVSQIFRIVHPLFSECSHKDWEEETEKLIKELK